MKQRYIYMLNHKPSGTPLQDVFLTRQESREAKRLYESRDGEKYSIVRFQIDKKVR